MRNIVDSSFLRNPRLRDYLNSSGDNFAVFCDYACMEAYKGNAIKNTYESINIVSDFPTQIIILKGTRELFSRTLNYEGQDSLIDKSQTEGFDEFCKLVFEANKGNNDISRQILLKAKDAKTQFAQMHKDSRNVAQGIIEYKKSFKPEYLKIIRTNRLFNHEMISKMINDIMLLTAFLFEGHPDVERIPTVNQVKNSYAFRFALCAYMLMLDWVANGGIDNVSLDKLTSDSIDLHYVAYATYFDGLLTEDDKMKRVHYDSTIVLDNAFSTLV